MMKRVLSILFILLIISCGVCEAEGFKPIYPLRAEAPELSDEGFTIKENEHYILIDEEKGEWSYIDNNLFVNIRRFQDTVERNRKLVWYESELKMRNGEKLITRHANPEKIGRRFRYAEEFAGELNAVFAMSDDFYGFRVYQKRLPGIIIQDGKILADKTRKESHYTLPTYDTMALFKDGSMKTYLAGKITAEELLEKGATDAWTFGPVLLSNGEIGKQVSEKSFENVNPRMCLGMIEPNHFFVMTVEGRSRRSDGVGLMWVSDRMKEKGCVEALNLDGGNSIKLVFMGNLVNANNTEKTKNRSVTSLITLGSFPFDTLVK